MRKLKVNASQINYGEVDCANHVSQEDVNIFDAVTPFVVDSNTAQAMYDEHAFVAVHQGNNTASITSSLTPRKPRHTNRGQGRGSNSFGKGGFGRGQPSSQGRSLSGRGRFSGGKGKGRRNNPSTGKLTSTSYYGNTPSKIIHEHEILNTPKLNNMYRRVSDTAIRLARSARLQGHRVSSQPGDVFPYNKARTSLNMDIPFKAGTNNNNNNNIITSAMDLQKTIHMFNLRGKLDKLDPQDRESLIDLQKQLYTSIVNTQKGNQSQTGTESQMSIETCLNSDEIITIEESWNPTNYYAVEGLNEVNSDDFRSDF